MSDLVEDVFEILDGKIKQEIRGRNPKIQGPKHQFGTKTFN